MRYGLILLLVGLLLVAVLAQESSEFDCSPLGMNRQIDSWYNDYLNDRGEVDVQQSVEALNTLNSNIDALLAACGVALDAEATIEAIVQTGIGSLDAPYVAKAPATVGDTTLTVVNVIRPADEILSEAGLLLAPAPAGQHYVLVYLEMSCAQFSASGCDISNNAFRLYGTLGVYYLPMLHEFDDYFPENSPIVGGGIRTGAIPFLVNADDENLLLAYYQFGDAVNPSASPRYFVTEGVRSGIEVSSATSELLIRSAPNRGAAPLGALRAGQTATALGRNEDGSWIYIQAPEATGWVSAAFLETDADLMTLEVVEGE
jgi:hypothetical protein